MSKKVHPVNWVRVPAEPAEVQDAKDAKDATVVVVEQAEPRKSSSTNRPSAIEMKRAEEKPSMVLEDVASFKDASPRGASVVEKPGSSTTATSITTKTPTPGRKEKPFHPVVVEANHIIDSTGIGVYEITKSYDQLKHDINDYRVELEKAHKKGNMLEVQNEDLNMRLDKLKDHVQVQEINAMMGMSSPAKGKKSSQSQRYEEHDVEAPLQTQKNSNENMKVLRRKSINMIQETENMTPNQHLERRRSLLLSADQDDEADPLLSTKGDAFGLQEAKKAVNGKLSPGKNVQKDLKKLMMTEGAVESLFSIKNIRKAIVGTYRAIYRCMLYFLPFEDDISAIEAQFGSAVKSYFLFFRFIFIQFSLLGLFALVFTIIHIDDMVGRGDDARVSNGAGYMPGFMYYSTYEQSERYLYSVFLVIEVLLVITYTSAKYVKEDLLGKEIAAEEDVEKTAPFSLEILSSWNFAAMTERAAADQRGTLRYSFQLELEDARREGKKKERTPEETRSLYIRRAGVFILYILLQAASFTAIIFTVIHSDRIAEAFTSSTSFDSSGRLVAQLIFNVINLTMPTLLTYITSWEKWDDGRFEVNLLLFRMYLSNIVNIMIISFSYVLLSNPYVAAEYPDFRRTLGVPVDDSFECRIDQAADSLFSLVLSTFIINQLSFAGMPLAKELATYCTGVSMVNEFDIAYKMISLFAFTGLVMLAFPFSPLSMVIVPIYLLVQFKWQVFCTLSLYVNPKKSWKAETVGTTFTAFFFATLFLIGLPVTVFFLAAKSFPKACPIQDNFIGLCVDGTFDTQFNNCTTNSNSIYYAEYGRTVPSNYPAVICDDACGPFVNDDSIMNVFKSLIFQVPVIEPLYDGFIGFPYWPWFLVFVLSMYIATERNTDRARKGLMEKQEELHHAYILSLEIDNRQLQRRIAELKTQLSSQKMR